MTWLSDICVLDSDPDIFGRNFADLYKDLRSIRQVRIRIEDPNTTDPSKFHSIETKHNMCQVACFALTGVIWSRLGGGVLGFGGFNVTFTSIGGNFPPKQEPRVNNTVNII